MSYSFTNAQPIFEQIIEYLVVEIANGKHEKDGRVPSVRDYALLFGVNPNTVQRALTELEREGILYSKRGDGRFIGNINKAILTCEKIANQKAKVYVQEMKKLGFTADKIVNLTKEVVEENGITSK